MKASLLIICLFLTCAASAQPRINCTNLTDSSLNYLYIGADNPIELANLKIPAENVVISISGGGGSITKVAPYKYIVRVRTVTDNATITISNKTKFAFKEEFKVRHIAEPKYNWESGTITNRDSLLKQPFLSLTGPDGYYKQTYEIVSYVATIDDGEAIVSYAITGSNFSPAFINHLQTKKNGTLLTFDDIRAKGPDGTSRKIPSIALYLK